MKRREGKEGKGMTYRKNFVKVFEIFFSPYKTLQQSDDDEMAT